MKKILLVVWIFTSCLALATHNRSGYISFKHVDALTYQVTLTTYTDACSGCGDRCEMLLDWGDGTTAVLERINGFNQNGNCPNKNMGEITYNPAIKVNIYQGNHTYSAPGSYTVSTEDPNRNAGISNIQNSVDVPFYIQSLLVADSITFGNNAPKTNYPPLVKGKIGESFQLNLGMYDVDGDNLHYFFAPTKTTGGQIIPDTYNVDGNLTLNEFTGELNWLPEKVGKYIFTIGIEECRNNQILSKIYYDIQVEISGNITDSIYFSGTSSWPIDANGNFYFEVIPGDTFALPVTFHATDNQVSLKLYGELDSTLTTSSTSVVSDTFIWLVDSSFIRCASYPLYIRGISGFLEKDLTVTIKVVNTLNCTGCNYVGIEQLTQKDYQGISIAPNPFHDHFLLNIPNLKDGDKLTLTIYDLNGQEIYHGQNITHQNTEIYFKPTNKGIYLYRLTNSQKVIKLGKLVSF